MGYELWTSPVTGYRRRGTRLSEMRALVSAGIQSRAIFEPLQCCPADAPALEMRAALEHHGFDVAGVQERRDGPVIGYVERPQLQGQMISDHVLPLRAEDLVSDATSIAEVLSNLATKPRVFVVVGSGVKAIITRADLNKPPVRIYLFGLISLLEMHLRYWVRDAYPHEGWRDGLSPERLEAARRLQEVRRQRNDQISLLACLQFGDLRELILAQVELRGDLGLGGKGKAKQMLERAEELRNRLAHSQDDLVEGQSWEKLIDTVTNIESVLTISDDKVEGRSQRTEERQANLWIAG